MRDCRSTVVPNLALQPTAASVPLAVPPSLHSSAAVEGERLATSRNVARRSQAWLRTDEYEEAASAAEAAADFSSTVLDDPYRWKWVLIAVHNTVQGFMVLALRRGNGLLALRDDIAAAWLKAHREGGPFPKEKLDNFLNLYAKIKTDAAAGYVHSKRFTPGPTHDRSMKKLNEFRNKFIHFVPMGWSLELAGLPGICIDCLTVANFLHTDGGNIFWNHATLRRRADRALRRATKLLARADSAYKRELTTASSRTLP